MAADTPHEGVLIVDTNKRIVFADSRTCELLNVEQSTLLGSHCGDVRNLFPCAEESCGLSSDCKLLEINSAQSRSNRLATFASRPVKGIEGQKLGVVHIVTLPEISVIQPEKMGSSFEGIIGRSEAMQKVFELIELVSKTGVTVHIHGESGTGKELIAEAIHSLSERRAKRLVKVNCSTIAQSLLESALFGHVKGAFTGAHKDQRGFVEHADGGTLFLDEIGDVSLDIQVKLLRLLQNREYQRVGEAQTRHVDLRIITATNQNLLSLVSQGKIREDFYYRVNVFPITVPPLRQRLEDLPLLLDYFVTVFNSRFSKEILGVSPEALAKLKSYDWPGNVRELEHAVEHAFVKAANGYLQLDHFPGANTYSTHVEVVEDALVSSDVVDERELIIRELKNANGKVSDAASRLGYSRVTLWKKMKRYGIDK